LADHTLGDICTRFARVLVDRVLGVEVGGGEIQDSGYYGNHCGGFDVVLPGYICLPSCTWGDPAVWTGKYDGSSPFWTATNDT